MWSTSSTIIFRRLSPSHQPWVGRPYQARAVTHLLQRGAAALFLDVGLGKTAIVLEAFRQLKLQGVARSMLVIAPLRVCQSVWRQEGEKWTQFRDLRFSILHGDKKQDNLNQDADVWLINPEGVAWLCRRYTGRPLPFDTVVIDELPKFKNHRAERFKALRPRIAGCARRWGLTGTPVSNGYMDLFGQMLILDDGAALGRYITHYRDQYFQLDYNGFDYSLMPGGAERIEERIRPYVLRMAAADYLTLPPVIDNIINVELDKESRATYERMHKAMVAELPEGDVTAANAAAVSSKLKQMANGAVYIEGEPKAARIHDAKLDAVEDLLEELAGQPLLLAYEFVHDYDRLKAKFGDRLHHLGSGQSEKAMRETIAAWNAGKIDFLACHPASAGHGLNLQESSCANICWFSPPWDLELYSQFIGRVHRSGNTAQRIMNHLLVVKKSIDEAALSALRDKDTTQRRLLDALNSEIKNGEIPASGQRGEIGDKTMVQKLSRSVAPQAQEESKPVVPASWGRVGAAAPDDSAQRERIQEKIAPKSFRRDPTESVAAARSAFSDTVLAQKAAIETPAVVEAAPQGSQTVGLQPYYVPATTKDLSLERLKVEVLKIAFNDPQTSLDDGLEVAKSLLEWVRDN